MQPLLFDVPRLYGTIFTLVAAIWCVPELIGTFFQRSRERATRSDRGSYLILIGTIGLGVWGAFLSAMWLPQLAVTAGRYAIYWLGIAMMLAGMGLRWYAISLLGRAFTRDVATRADQTLVETGPYRYIRHPAYSGALLTMLGMAVALSNVGSVILVLLGGLLGLTYRIRIEEQALAARFGQRYQDYMSRTRRLIPFVW